MPGSGGSTGVSLPQPCAWAVFMSLISWSGSLAFSLGLVGELPITQAAAATFFVIVSIDG